MKKRLFTLFALVLCVVGGGFAEANTTLIDGVTLPSLPSGTYTGGTTVSHNGTNTAVVVDGNGNAVMQAIAPCYGSPTAANFTWANAYEDGTNKGDGFWSTTGDSWDAPASSFFAGSTAYTTKGNAHYLSFSRRGNLRTNRTFAYRFTNCGSVSVLVMSQGNSAGSGAVLAVYEIGAGNALTSAGSKTSIANAVDIITVDGLSMSKTYVAYVYGENGSNGELYEIAFSPTLTDPVISADDASITATESGVEATQNVAVTGANLTGATLTATLSPAVAGLSVSLQSNTITDGAISTNAVLAYTATENARGTTTLTLSDGTTSKAITVTYKAKVTTTELATISEETVWDFNSGVTGAKHFTGEDANIENVYADIADLTYAPSFNDEALAFKGEYPFRDNSHKFAMNGTLHFKTAYPGKLTVKFSDTGNSASPTAVKRYLIINGEQTEFWASREKTGDGAYAAQLNQTADVKVPAGDVSISGSSALIYTYVKFTPVTEVNGTITASGYNTYSSNYPLDLSQITGGTAYVATDITGDGKVVLTKCTGKIAAGAGVMIAGDAGSTFTIKTSSVDATYDGENLLKGLPNGGIVSKAEAGKYNYVFGWPNSHPDKAGFYLINTESAELGNFKAYLQTTEALSGGAGARLSLSFGDETTAIQGVENVAKQDGKFFNLNGQQVMQPTKGLYIVNGKKVIIK